MHVVTYENRGKEAKVKMGDSTSGNVDKETFCTDIYDMVSEKYHLPLAILYITVFILGLVNNITLLLIYARHREMRIPHNIMFISLAIADTFFLLIHVGMFRIGHLFHVVVNIPSMGNTNCRVVLFFIGISVGVSPYTVAAVSFQRFVRIFRHAHPESKWCRSFLTRPVTVHATMSLFAIIVAIPNAVCSTLCVKDDASHTPLIFWKGIYPFFFYGLLPMVVIGGCYYASVRQKMVQVPPKGLKDNIRMRTAKVLLALTVVYIVTFTPVLMCELSRFWYTSPNCTDPVALMWVCAVGVLLFNPVLNPLALCVASVRIRQYFKYYLLFCFKSNRELKNQNKMFREVTVYKQENLRGSTSSQ